MAPLKLIDKVSTPGEGEPDVNLCIALKQVLMLQFPADLAGVYRTV